jgi:hypothetical protein
MLNKECYMVYSKFFALKSPLLSDVYSSSTRLSIWQCVGHIMATQHVQYPSIMVTCYVIEDIVFSFSRCLLPRTLAIPLATFE